MVFINFDFDLEATAGDHEIDLKYQRKQVYYMFYRMYLMMKLIVYVPINDILDI